MRQAELSIAADIYRGLGAALLYWELGLPVEGIEHLNDDEDRQGQSHGLGSLEDVAVHAGKHGRLGQTLHVMSLQRHSHRYTTTIYCSDDCDLLFA